MRGLFIYFRRMSACQTGNIAGEFDCHQLHAVAQSEIRYLVLSREADRFYLPLDARLPESAWHNDAVELLQFRNGIRLCLIIFPIQPCYLRLHVLRVGREFDRFYDGYVRVGKNEIASVEIFANDAD